MAGERSDKLMISIIGSDSKFSLGQFAFNELVELLPADCLGIVASHLMNNVNQLVIVVSIL